MTITLLVVAKAPVPGYAKTRLCPPATAAQAAAIAAAALLDTLDATTGYRTVVALAGRLAHAERSAELRAALARCDVVRQRGRCFATRLANAQADAARAGCPVLQIGMDTPQVHGALFDDAAAALRGTDAVLGPAADGGWWGLGLHDPRHARVLLDVPMSTPDTGELTLRALRAAGLRVGMLPELSDVDTMADAARVVGEVPGSRFAVAVMSALQCAR
ncbi:MAG TPA: DUF2064 domain-containing protein [Pseudonocardiaceae bacterium]